MTVIVSAICVHRALGYGIIALQNGKARVAMYPPTLPIVHISFLDTRVSVIHKEKWFHPLAQAHKWQLPFITA